MKSIEAGGKNVKDAIKNGLNELQCDASDVEIQVLEMGSPGLFGMFGKPAKVRLTLKDRDDDMGIEMPVITLDGGKKSSAKPAAKAESKSAVKSEPKPAVKSEPKPVVQSEEKPAEAEEEEAETAETTEVGPKPERKRKPRREHKPAQTAEAEEVSVETEPFTATPEEELTEETKKAREFLMGLTERMGVPIQVEIAQSAEQLRFRMSGENMSLLIGRRGETLDAMQYLTSLTVNKGRDEYLRVCLDTENYRAKREEALRKLALRMAAKAKKTGKRVALEPMNPYERRILHSALQSDPAVTTHSEGEDPYRRVIITLK